MTTPRKPPQPPKPKPQTKPSSPTPETPDVVTLLANLDRLERACKRLRGTVVVLSEPRSPEVVAHVGSTCRGWVPHLLNLSSNVARELVALDPAPKGGKNAR